MTSYFSCLNFVCSIWYNLRSLIFSKVGAQHFLKMKLLHSVWRWVPKIPSHSGKPWVRRALWYIWKVKRVDLCWTKGTSESCSKGPSIKKYLLWPPVVHVLGTIGSNISADLNWWVTEQGDCFCHSQNWNGKSLHRFKPTLRLAAGSELGARICSGMACIGC